MTPATTDATSVTSSILAGLLQFAQAGLAGVAILSVALTYQLLKGQIDSDRRALINRFMTVSIILAILSGMAQIVNLVIADKVAVELRNTKELLRQAQDGAMPLLSYDYVSGNWSWQWAAGNWESEARFSRNEQGELVFSAQTFFHQGSNNARELMQTFTSDPIVIPAGGVPLLSFDGWRDILDKPIAKQYLGAPQHWREHFELSGGKELRGTYRGFVNGVPVPEAGNIVLYMPP